MEVSRQKVFTLVVIIAVIFLAGILIVAMVFKNNNTPQPIVSSESTTTADVVASTVKTPKVSSTPEQINLKGATAVVAGANMVRPNGSVVTSLGEITKTDVTADSPLAPQQTAPIGEKDLSRAEQTSTQQIVKLTISKTGFAPNSFSVNSSAPITISLTNLDKDMSHTMAFNSPAMSGVILGTRPGETRAITFNAPAVGDYSFICGIPSHDGNVEKGIMTVK
jgi:uncharacterized cupredoxin-like copper-binding protein